MLRIAIPTLLLAVLGALLLAACSGGQVAPTTAPSPDSEAEPAMTDPTAPEPESPAKPMPSIELETATLGAGCFWCVEAVLEQLDGVHSVTSGYMGGSVENPTYRAVCTGTTGHAEVVQVNFDAQVISYGEILDWFWQLHDPTTLNRQGADVGTQYRSVIFYHSDAQRKAAEASKLAAAKDFDRPIVTEITAASTYYEAEQDHQDFYVQNRENNYCRAVIRPKLKKLGLKE